MKRIFSFLLCAVLLTASLLTLNSCVKMSLKGVFITEDGENNRIYTFTSERLIVTELINEVSYDMYFLYELREENGEEFLDLEYEGIVYEGNDIYVAHMVNALDQNHKKSPNSTKSLQRNADHIILDDLKLVKS
ncbi:MAG: hypothetical protein IJX80_09220 [Clostridia bacterium]|nr:hypothetical protein [Clostridia bacterium]